MAAAGIALVVAAKELRQRVRDRSAIIVGFVAPFVLALIISSALGHAFTSFHATYALYDEDGGPVSAVFVRTLRTPPLSRVVTLRVVGSRAAVVALAGHDADAGFVVPSGFSARVAAGAPAEIEVLRNRASFIAGQVGVDIARGFAARVAGAQLAVRAALAAGPRPVGSGVANVDLAALGQRTASAPPIVSIVDGAGAGRQTKPASYFGPAMAIFFLFFTVGVGARSILAERQQGTLARLRAAPMPLWPVLVGKLLAGFVLGLASLTTLLVASSALLGASWGAPAAVLGLAVATVLAAMAVTAVVVTLAKTEEQAGGYSSAVGVLLALVGGNFVPISQAPGILRRVTLVTPNGWALRGFADLASGSRATTVIPDVLVLLVFALIVGGVALARSPRLVEL